MTIETLDITKVKAMTAKKGATFKASGVGFSDALDTISAGLGPVAATTTAMYGTNTALATLNAAFSGIGTASSAMGGGYNASFGGGVSSGAPYLAAGASYSGQNIGTGGLSTNSAVSGVDGLSQADMINTMNQNNLQLLELQAMMQNNMQAWNTKSNILSADHRSRMSMIEKFTARG